MKQLKRKFPPAEKEIKRAAEKAESIRDLAYRLHYKSHPGSNTSLKFRRILGAKEYKKLSRKHRSR